MKSAFIPCTALTALLLYVVVPTAAHADCVEQTGSDFAGRPTYSTPVSLHDRELVESLIETRIDRIACAHFTPDVRLDARRSAAGSHNRGYVVLTATSVMYISGQRGLLYLRQKNDVLFEASYEELSEFSVFGKDLLPGVAIDIGNSSMGASFIFPRGSYGNDFVAELRRRFIAGCKTSVWETAERVICQ